MSRQTHKARGNILVDLDGTLAMYDKWRGSDHIGEPIPEMVARIKAWLEAGYEVRIFTARASHLEDEYLWRPAIEAWCREHIGVALPIVCGKDFATIEIWDDRAITVGHNEGRIIQGKSRVCLHKRGSYHYRGKLSCIDCNASLVSEAK